MDIEKDKELLKILELIEAYNKKYPEKIYGAKVKLVAVNVIKGYDEDEMEDYTQSWVIGINEVRSHIESSLYR